MKLFWLIVVMIIVTATLSFAAEPNISGKWIAHVMGSKVEAQVQQKGSEISGVASVYDPFGKKDKYHFFGNILDGNITASHSSGHMFTGKLTPNNHLVGTLKTKGGKKITINASRK